MDREVVLIVLALCLCGPLAVIVGAVPTRLAAFATGWELERFWWRRLWLPVIPAALVIATLIGWAIQEPDETDEIVSRLAVFLALGFAVIWVRAAARATRSLVRRPGRRMIAATIGILRPRVFISPELVQLTDPEVVAAAFEHEAAHARHGDPGRIWLAQLASDLQWPSRAALARWEAWREALEFARDDEARSRGADGATLAEAILAAIRLPLGEKHPAAAMLGGEGAALRTRINRLLAPLPLNATPPRSDMVVSVVMSVMLLAAGASFGLFWGDVLLRALPIVGQ